GGRGLPGGAPWLSAPDGGLPDPAGGGGDASSRADFPDCLSPGRHELVLDCGPRLAGRQGTWRDLDRFCDRGRTAQQRGPLCGDDAADRRVVVAAARAAVRSCAASLAGGESRGPFSPWRVRDGDSWLAPVRFPPDGCALACGRFRDAARRGRSRTVDLGGLGVDDGGRVAVLRRADLRAYG